jgi:mRNA-degrading endonuclease RelE of RelBE toxin-antitoxin system
LEFIETSQFSRLREKYLDDARFNLLQLYLMESPDAGDVIQGSGGVRKLRWGTKGQGKQGGLRVVYYWNYARRPDSVPDPVR